MTWIRAREALLKPEYRDWYPGLVPGVVGYVSRWLAARVRHARRYLEPRWELEPRIPNEAHFFFRGGWRHHRIHRWARVTDRALA